MPGLFKNYKCFLLGLTIFLIASSLNAASQKMSGIRILYINSDNASSKWSGDVLNGFREYFHQYAPDALLDMVELNCMNSKDFQTDPENIRHLKTLLQNNRYDLILAADNPAADLFLDKKLLPPPQTTVIFCGYDTSGKKLKPLPPQITGLLLPSCDLMNIEFGLKLFPRTKTIAILTGAAPTGIDIHKEISKESARFSGIRFLLINGKEYSTQKMLSALQTLPKDSFVILNGWTTSAPGDRVPLHSIWKQIKEIYKGPVFNSTDHIFGEKIFGGVMTAGSDHGRETAILALQFLQSAAPLVQPPKTGMFRHVMHYPSMKEYGIDSSRLPKETIFTDPPKSFLLRYHPVAVIGLASLLISGLFFSLVFLLHKQRSLRKQKIIYDALPVRIVVADADERICFHQVHKEDSNFNLTPRTLSDFSENAQKIFRNPIRKVLESGKPLSFNYTLDGRRRHVEFQRLPKDIFGVISVLWISTDIDELEKARAEMTQLAERFQLTFHSIGDAVLVTDENENIILANPAAEKLTGYASEELIGQKLSAKINLVEQESQKEHKTSIREALMIGHEAGANPMVLISKEGTRRHIAGSITPIFNFSGSLTGAVMVFRDVTEEFEKRNRIFMQKNLLEAAADFAGITYFRLDREGKQIQMLQNQAKFWEVSSDRLTQSVKEWVHPDDLPNFKNEWNTLFNRKKDSLRIIYRGGKNNQYRYFEMRCRKTVNPENAHEEFFGIIRDIHEEKTAELELHNANQLIQSVMDSIPCLLYVKDFKHEDRYLFVSKHFLEKMTLESGSVIGKNDHDIFPKELADQYLHTDRQVMETRKESDFLESIVSADGVQRTVQTRKLCIERETGNLLLGISFDITDLINSRNELQAYAQQEKMINTCLQSIMLIEEDDEALQTALRHACEYFNATRCYIMAYDYETSQTIPFQEYFSHGSAPLLNSVRPIPFTADDPWQKFHKSHKSFLADRADTPETLAMEGGWAPCVVEHNIKSFACHGIWLGKKLWGSFGLLFEQDYHTFTQQDKSTLPAFAHMLEIILERKKKRSELARSEFEKRLIMDTIRIPILLFSPDLNLVRVNNAALQISGKTEKEIYSNPCYCNFCMLQERPGDCPTRLARMDRQIHSRELNISGRNYLLSAYPIEYENKLIYILKTMIDITDSKVTQQQLTRALLEAQNAAKAKSFFLATMSHELRTPLNAVIGFSELLQKDSLSREEQTDALQSIHYAGNALLNLINDVLDLSKIESEQMNIVPQPTDIRKLVEEIASIFRYKAEEKKLMFELHCPDDLPIIILDTLRLRQILLNLIGNAFKFTNKGSVTFSIAFNNVNPATRRGDLILAVADTGIGISKESQEKLFMPFVQQYAVRDANVYKGTGLGLAISQRLATRMGGSIQLESEPGKGSTFTLHLANLEYESPRHEKTPPQQTTPAIDANLAKRKILLVDDVPMNLKVLAAMLKQMGFETRTAVSGQEALEQIGKEPPDIVLTDLWMPGMGGVELVDAIRKDPRYNHLILIAITADTEADKNFSLRGFNEILFKPITLEKLKDFFVNRSDDMSFSHLHNNN